MTAPRLSPAVTASTGVRAPTYDRNDATAGVVHIGLGAFARGHVARYCDDLLALGDPSAAMFGVSIRSGSTIEALGPQSGLYTLTETDARSSRDRIIGAVTRLGHGADAAVSAIAGPEAHVVTLTITEKGYHHSLDHGLDVGDPGVAHDLAHPDDPATAPGVLVAGLRRRRDAGLAGIPIVSCDNLDSNGSVTARVVGDLAARVDPGLATWIEGNVAFPSTVVDRIVPATTDADRESVVERLGYVDAAPVRAETHCGWVIERVAALPAWDSVGAIMVDDVGPWQQRKLRAVNGPHSALAYLGGLAGHATIDAAAGDETLAAFVTALIEREVAPGLSGGDDAESLAAETLARFANPALGHRCAQVAADGSRKLRQRIVDVIAQRRAAGEPYDRLALVVAGWMSWVIGSVEGRHLLVDPDAAALAAAVRAAGSCPERRVGVLMTTSGVFPPDLADDASLRGAVVRGVRLIDSVGSATAARATT